MRPKCYPYKKPTQRQADKRTEVIKTSLGRGKGILITKG